MKKYIKKNKFIIGLFLFSLILRLIVVLCINTPIISDFKTMYDAATELLNGTSEYKKTPYFLTYGYQMGHVIYQFFFLKICNSAIFLKIISCLITSFIPVFIYLISKKIASEKSAKIVSILYSVFLFPLLLNTVLTNQHLPLLLTLIAIYILLNMKNKIIIKSIVIGLLLGISNILRSEGIVYITALIIYSIYLIIKKNDFKKIIISLVIIIVSYIGIFNITSNILISKDLSINGLKNMNPTWKFVAGFNYDKNGIYNDLDASLYSSYKQSDIAKKELKNRVSQIDKIPLHFLKKVKIFWFNSDLSWSIGHIDYNTYNILNSINKVTIYIINILVFFSLFSLFKIKKISNTQILVTLIVVIYFGVYLLIEVMPRYAYAPQVFLFILAAIGIDNIIKIKRNSN